MLYLAIDQHRKQLIVNLRNEEGDVLLRRQVSTQWDKVREFFDDLRQQSGPSSLSFENQHRTIENGRRMAVPNPGHLHCPCIDGLSVHRK